MTRRRYVAFALWWLAVGPASAATWQLVGPGGGGWIQSLAYAPHDPDRIYLGCDVGGFYVSTDAGRTWSIQNRGLRDPYVEAIVPDPTRPERLYCGTLSGVHRSDDGGRTWRLLRRGFPPGEPYRYSAPIGCLALDPRRPDTVYAGIGIPRHDKGGQGRLYRSDDAGETWTQVVTPGALPADALLSDLAFAADGTLLAATQHGVLASSDRGATWTARNEGLSNRHARRLAISPANPQVVYLTVQSTPGQEPFDGGVYRSDDAGRTWRRCITGLAPWLKKGDGNLYLTAQYDRLVVDPRNPETVYVGGRAWVNASLWKSTDGGATWREVLLRGLNNGPKNVDVGYITFWGPSVECLALHPARPERLIFGTSGHAIATDDGGGQWRSVYTRREADGGWSGHGLEVTCVWSMTAHPTQPGEWLIGYMDIGLWRTHNAGQSLHRSMVGVPRDHEGVGQSFVYDPTDATVVYGGFGQWGSNKGGLYLSRDGGSTWAPRPGLPEGQIKRIVVDPDSPAANRRLWVLSNQQGLYEGRLAGGEWTRQNGNLPGPLLDVLLLPGAPRQLLGLARLGAKQPVGLFRRAASGGTWQRLDDDLPVAEPCTLAVAPSDPQRVYLTARRTYLPPRMFEGGLYASRDGGRTFARMFNDHFIQAVAVHPTNPDLVVIGGNDHPYHDEPLGCGVHLSRDGGRTWRDITDDLTLPNVTCLVFDPTDPRRIIAGTGGNSVCWRRLPE